MTITPAQMQNDILDAVEKSLPAIQVDWLAEKLAQNDRLKEENKALNQAIAAANQHHEDHHVRQAELEKLVKTEDELDAREAEIRSRLEALTIREAIVTLKEDHAAQQVSTMRSVVSDVFSGPILRQSMSRPISVELGHYERTGMDGSIVGIPGGQVVETHVETSTTQEGNE